MISAVFILLEEELARRASSSSGRWDGLERGSDSTHPLISSRGQGFEENDECRPSCSGPQRQVSVQDTRCDRIQNLRRADPSEMRGLASQTTRVGSRQYGWLVDRKPSETSSLGGVGWTGLLGSKGDEGEYVHTNENYPGTATPRHGSH